MLKTTWVSLKTLKVVSPPSIPVEELRRRERVAAARVCMCGQCVCCAEYRKDQASRRMWDVSSFKAV